MSEAAHHDAGACRLSQVDQGWGHGAQGRLEGMALQPQGCLQELVQGPGVAHQLAQLLMHLGLVQLEGTPLGCTTEREFRAHVIGCTNVGMHGAPLAYSVWYLSCTHGKVALIGRLKNTLAGMLKLKIRSSMKTMYLAAAGMITPEDLHKFATTFCLAFQR